MNEDEKELFKYLHPPADVYNINHDQNYILAKKSNGKKIRNIFYNVTLTDQEEQEINQFEDFLKQQNINLPIKWERITSLKYLYVQDFNYKKSFETIKNHIQWLNNQQIQNPQQQIIDKYLNAGFIYTFGRDNQYRPIVIINADKLKALKAGKQEMVNIIAALCKILNTVNKYMFVKGKVENWIIIIETNGQGLFDLDFNALVQLINCMTTNYVCILHRLIITNPSWIFRQGWQLVSVMLQKFYFELLI
ncbi:hypothetical protein IMG5_148000 [Ichthyophthirius multifiliis]|uniref:CRAL-TRIO domain-containing protein n=1 Tax=Ichthyophthirius multifiliis TaxID=5932 RepID=G0QY77_ICHMU|nr:hypothetical protein IMG5_148000 [Ichthyophthirius multifiliis]EGR29816.1 hypothetical protein IMG5_148000 [Ichthyophthirius multifiliis]|eukprot:XP_004031052.1 hypothetical protein IMG5_148000 [Ichthyophthirius multifiliis]